MTDRERIAALEAQVRDLQASIELLKSAQRGARQKVDAVADQQRRDHQRIVILEHAPLTRRAMPAREIFRARRSA